MRFGSITPHNMLPTIIIYKKIVNVLLLSQFSCIFFRFFCLLTDLPEWFGGIICSHILFHTYYITPSLVVSFIIRYHAFSILGCDLLLRHLKNYRSDLIRICNPCLLELLKCTKHFCIKYNHVKLYFMQSRCVRPNLSKILHNYDVQTLPQIFSCPAFSRKLEQIFLWLKKGKF